MDWLGSGLVSDILGAGSGLFGTLFGQSSAEDAATQSFNRQLQLMDIANKMNYDNWIFQQTTKHQKEVQDLKAAGINPLISATGSSSASFGNISAPSVNQANSAQGAAAMANAFSGAFANLKNAQANMINAKANATSADAAMIKAQNDTTLTNFHIGPEFELKAQVSNAEMNNLIAASGLSRSQTAINVIQSEWLPKLLKAQLNVEEMKYATGYMVAKAQDYYYRHAGDAAIISAQASASQAAAAWANVSLNERSVAIAEMLGLKEGQLKDAQKREVEAKVDGIIEDTKSKQRINAYNKEYDEHVTYTGSRYVGEVLGNLNPLKGWP